jgi:hypothetical protein
MGTCFSFQEKEHLAQTEPIDLPKGWNIFANPMYDPDAPYEHMGRIYREPSPIGLKWEDADDF